MTLTCRICLKTLPLSSFYKDPRYKHGVKYECKKCTNKLSCQWARENKDIRLKAARAWRDKNHAHALDYARRWRDKNREKCRAYSAKSKVKHRNVIKERRAKWWQRNYPRLKSDLNWYLTHTIRDRIRASVKGARRYRSVTELLGCSIEDFRIYLETNFEPGMSWQNHGEWEIDHIMPCAIFDLTNPQHQKRCFHFSNQQPLWKRDNRVKAAKVATKRFFCGDCQLWFYAKPSIDKKTGRECAFHQCTPPHPVPGTEFSETRFTRVFAKPEERQLCLG